LAALVDHIFSASAKDSTATLPGMGLATETKHDLLSQDALGDTTWSL
jgi:hypothetical protein